MKKYQSFLRLLLATGFLPFTSTVFADYEYYAICRTPKSTDVFILQYSRNAKTIAPMRVELYRYNSIDDMLNGYENRLIFFDINRLELKGDYYVIRFPEHTIKFDLHALNKFFNQDVTNINILINNDGSNAPYCDVNYSSMQNIELKHPDIKFSPKKKKEGECCLQ